MSRREKEGVSYSLKYEKNAKVCQRGNYAKMRLSGGADTRNKSGLSANKSPTETSAKVTPATSETLRPDGQVNEEVSPTLQDSSSNNANPGEKKVNEMIDYVIHNLQEAEKALASLGGNFEHELKLMLVEIMGKFQNWVSLAQVRLDEAKNNLDELRRELVSKFNELATKNQEILDLKAKLNETEASRATLEENLRRSKESIQASPTRGARPSRQALPTTPLSQQLAGSAIRSDSQPSSQEGTSSPQELRDTSPETQHRVSQVQFKDPQAEFGTSSQAQFRTPQAPYENSSQAQFRTPQAPYENSSQAQFRPGGQLDPGQASGQFGVHPDRRSYGALGADKRYQEGFAYNGPGQTVGAPGSEHFSDLDRRSKNDVGVQSGKSKDRSKRSTDLELELCRLKKENERIMKEKTDYENAIQRALLRGVSSLNAETLKVLKSPPSVCYTPCPPPTPVDCAEANAPCLAMKTRDNWTPRGCKVASNVTTTSATQWGEGSVKVAKTVVSRPEQEIKCCGAKLSGATSKSFSKKKSPATSDQSVYLLHQADVSSVCVSGAKVRPCARMKTKKHDTSVFVKKL